MILSCGAAIFAAMGQDDKINFNSLHDWKQKFNENVFSRKEETDQETKADNTKQEKAKEAKEEKKDERITLTDMEAVR